MNELIGPVTPDFLEDWVCRALLRRLELHYQITDPIYAVRQMAFSSMSENLCLAIQMVRAAGLALRERDLKEMWWDGDGAGV